MIPECECVADVGCDHGILGEIALELGRAMRVIASDVSQSSLEKARKRLAGRSNVSIRLGPGLAVLSPGEADVICISGMGAKTIMSIIEAALDTARSAQFLVLGAHRNHDSLRRFLREAKFRVCTEKLVCERGHYYPLLLVRPSRTKQETDHMHDLFGTGDLRDPVYRGFLEHVLERLTNLMRRIQTEHETERVGKLASIRNWILKTLEESWTDSDEGSKRYLHDCPDRVDSCITVPCGAGCRNLEA